MGVWGLRAQPSVLCHQPADPHTRSILLQPHLPQAADLHKQQQQQVGNTTKGANHCALVIDVPGQENEVIEEGIRLRWG